MWQRLGVLCCFLALMEAQRAPGAANVRFRVPSDEWDRIMSRGRCKYELGLQLSRAMMSKLQLHWWHIGLFLGSDGGPQDPIYLHQGPLG